MNTFIRHAFQDEIARSRTESRRFPNSDGVEDRKRIEEKMVRGRPRADAKRKKSNVGRGTEVEREVSQEERYG